MHQIITLLGAGDDRPHPMDYVSWLTFNRFIATIISESKVKSSVVLVASVYLDRCKAHFDAKPFGKLWLKEKVFVISVVLANKVSNCPTNKCARSLNRLSSMSKTCRVVLRNGRNYVA